MGILKKGAGRQARGHQTDALSLPETAGCFFTPGCLERRGNMREKIILENVAMERALTRIAHEIIERNEEMEGLALIGIQRRGVPLARRIASRIEAACGVAPAVGMIDITLYRDDLSELTEHPVISATDIPFVVQGRTIVMVDDVIFTGRTARSAMDAIMDMGRPKCLQLAAFIDRGHRELPIRPDYVGKNVPTSLRERIAVHVAETDGCDYVSIVQEEGAEEQTSEK